MLKVGYKIDENLFNVLSSMQCEPFTARQLKEAFCHELGVCCEQKNKDVQKWIYRQLDRLVKYELLKRQKEKNPRMTVYTKVSNFVDISFEFCDGPFLKMTPEVVSGFEVASTMVRSDGSTQSSISELKNRAKQCHVDLLSSVGESEEYKTLFKVYPSLREALQPRYQRALESSSKLLGQLRAIEAALEHYQATTS
ncbi:hypothetical protein [Neptuniibacter marinus]|uniref:hypothetical protein n=2 Tax=Neptuniibacter marinus TaxID=1806670 RepID=UPI00082C7BFC|nr:hypothetical protein [Neptuniibacter marinus]